MWRIRKEERHVRDKSWASTARTTDISVALTVCVNVAPNLTLHPPTHIFAEKPRYWYHCLSRKHARNP